MKFRYPILKNWRWLMTNQLFSVMNRALYFSIPEQKVIYDAVKDYIKRYPNSESADSVLKDFYRESFDR